MRNRARKNYVIYVLMLLLFGGLIYVAIEEGDRVFALCGKCAEHGTGESIHYVSPVYTG